MCRHLCAGVSPLEQCRRRGGLLPHPMHGRPERYIPPPARTSSRAPRQAACAAHTATPAAPPAHTAQPAGSSHLTKPGPSGRANSGAPPAASAAATQRSPALHTCTGGSGSGHRPHERHAQAAAVCAHRRSVPRLAPAHAQGVRLALSSQAHSTPGAQPQPVPEQGRPAAWPWPRGAQSAGGRSARARRHSRPTPCRRPRPRSRLGQGRRRARRRTRPRRCRGARRRPRSPGQGPCCAPLQVGRGEGG